jgi:autotransporter-associated beta strand protein
MYLGGSAATRVSSSVGQKAPHSRAKGCPLTSRGVVLLLGVSLAALTSGAAFAATDTWNGSGTSVNWSDAGNWSAGVPGANAVLVINQSGANAPSNYDISQTFGSVTFDTGATITNAGSNTFGIASGGFITDSASSAVTFASNLPVTLNGPATINVTAGSLTFGGGLTGTGPLTVNNSVGAGALVFLGSSTYSGGTTIATGALQLGDGINNGTITGDTVVDTGATLAFNEGSTVTYAGNITGGGQMTVSGPGTVVLTGTANNYSGGTTINTGSMLQIGNDTLQGSIAAGGNIVDNGALDFHNATSFFQYGGVISGTGTVALDQGTLTFTNVNTYSGGTTIGGAGTLQIGSASAVGGLNQNGAIVDNGTLNFANIGASGETLSGGISGTGNLGIQLLAGNGPLVLTGTNALTGSTSVINVTLGTLQIGNATTAGTLAGNVQLGAGTLDFANTGGPLTYSNFIQGAGSVEIGGLGDVILTNTNNSIVGGTTIDSGGILQIGDGATSSGSIFGPITNNGTLTFDPESGTANVLTISGAISGSGTVSQSGPGTTVLSGADSFSGDVSITNGTLEFGSGATFTGTGTFTVGTNGTLAFANSTALTFGNVITGAGQLNVANSAPLILTNADDYTGATTIGSGGTLQIGNATTAGAVTGTSLVTIAAGGNLDFVNSSSTTFTAPISGAGSVTVDLTSGSIALSGTNAYSGGTNIEGGTLQVASSSNLGTGAVSFTNGGTLQVASAGSYALAANVGTGGGAIDTDGNVVTWSGTITNASGSAGSLTVTDSTAPNSGVLILTGTNTYTGGTTITSNGTLQIGNETGSGSIVGAVTDNGFLNFAFGGNTSFSGAISGTGQITQDDTTGGTLTLGGTNTFSGPVTIEAGKLQVASASNLGDGSSTNYVYMDQGTTLAVSASATFGNKLYLNGDPTIQVANGTTTTWNGVIIDGVTPGTLNVNGGGTLVLTNTSNSYSGGTVVLGNSTLGIDSDSELGASTGGLTLGGTSPNSGGTLDVSTNSFTLGAGRAVVLAGSGGTVKTESGVTFEIANGISGSGALTVSGPGTFVLAGANTFTGNTTVATGGTLQLGDGTTAGTIQSAAVSDNGSLVFNEAGNLEFAAPISGTGSVTQNDTAGGTLTLVGAEGYTGNTTITLGTLQLGDGTNLGTVAGNIINNSALIFNEPVNVTYGNVISGSGSVTVNGTKTLVLTGNNTYTGATTIGAGAGLQVGNGGASGSISNSGSIVNNGTLTIDLNGTTTLTGGISGTGQVSQIGSGTTILAGANNYSGTTTVSSGTLQIGDGATSGSLTGDITDNSAVVFNRTDTSTYGGAITGSGTVTQAGAGTTILTGNSTYSGATTITAGTLQIGNGGTSGSLTSNIANSANLAFNRSDTSTYGGVITGNGTVTVADAGSGTTILTGTNTYTGATTVSSGTLQIGNGGTTGSLTSDITDNANVTFDRSDSSAYAGNITGSGSLTQDGTGTTELTGTNTYSGGTTIDSGGTLQLGNASAAGSITGNVTDNGTLAFDRSNSYVFNGIISGAGGVTQSGQGETTLIGTETYTGPTVVSGGTLLVNGNITASSGTTVGSGGTIGGTGTVGKLTINPNGNVTTGSGGIGTLTVNGNFILGPGATYMVGVTPTASDLLAVNGTATLQGALTVTPSGTGFSATPITILSATGGINGTFSSFTVFGGPNQIPLLSYTNDDVFLTFAPTVTSLLPGLSTDTNQSRVADAIDFALTHDNALALQPVTGETGAALTQTLSELSGETAVGFQNIAVSSVQSFMNTLFDPSIGGRGGLGGGTDGITDNKQHEQLAFNGANSDAPYHIPSLRAVTVWTSAYGYQDTTDANLNLGTHRTTSSQYGGTVGLDYRPKSGDGSLGIAVGMSGNTWNLAQQLGKGEATAYQVGAYYSRRFWDTYFTGGLSYARYSATTDRTVNLGGANLYHADFVSNALAARAEAGHVFHTDIGLITPFARFQADDIGVPHYSEQTQVGSPAYALTYTGKQHYDYTTELGTAWNTLIGPLTDLHARVGWLHDYAGGLNDIATFSEFNGASFTVDGASPPRDAAHIVLGIAHNVNNVVFSLNGETALAGTSTTYGGTASIAYRW